MVEMYKHNIYHMFMRKFVFIFDEKYKCVSSVVHYTAITWNQTSTLLLRQSGTSQLNYGIIIYEWLSTSWSTKNQGKIYNFNWNEVYLCVCLFSKKLNKFLTLRNNVLWLSEVHIVSLPASDVYIHLTLEYAQNVFIILFRRVSSLRNDCRLRCDRWAFWKIYTYKNKYYSQNH